MYQIEEYKNNTKYNEVSKQYEKIKFTAPSCPMRIIRHEPRVSVHKSGPVSNEKISDIDVPWLINPKFIYKRIWEIIAEEEGLGRQGNQLSVSYGRKLNFDVGGGSYQKIVAHKAVLNHGCYGNSKGGAGKSWTIQIIVDELTQKKYLVFGAAFTHVAVSNITHCFPNGACTITHFLLNKIPQIKEQLPKTKNDGLIFRRSKHDSDAFVATYRSFEIPWC